MSLNVEKNRNKIFVMVKKEEEEMNKIREGLLSRVTKTAKKILIC
jgi:hypothetical protein